MKQAVWSGTINFGLVSIPVKLYPATEPKDVRFHLYDRRSGKRVRYERVTREYMIRLDRADLDEPAKLEPIANAAGMDQEAFRARYEYLVRS